MYQFNLFPVFFAAKKSAPLDVCPTESRTRGIGDIKYVTYPGSSFVTRTTAQGSILDRLSTGNVWVDTALAAVIPVAMHYFLPGRSYKPLSGHLALDAMFLAVAPLLRAKRRHIQARLRAGVAGVFHGMRNTYETTIRFQKEVCFLRACPMRACSA